MGSWTQVYSTSDCQKLFLTFPRQKPLQCFADSLLIFSRFDCLPVQMGCFHGRAQGIGDRLQTVLIAGSKIAVYFIEHLDDA